ncbi:phosphate transport system regulatory protein PhoU [Nocardioides mangrovicus]|uniref:Phosphate-specific transport system accessory protein PhoU n=1 Tax=Nocardioides mangrovicus TaxID=2478913 RepID=A0A3L8NYH0_9ACTN|nr:phosphate signaling complex protein PhoU [Nocardioides mangrovicus]RLV47603.1 phosphate transport system regulatory protein PhoU [Nocardioides mangrovicus]
MRDAYADQLDGIRQDLVTMSRLVRTAVSQATESLLNGDANRAEQVISSDAEIDRKREEIEERSFELLSLQNPVAGDLRMLIAALRMVSEFERMGDLSVHVAKIARLRVPEIAVPEELEPTISRMAAIAEVMVGKVEVIIAERDADGARQLEEADEEMDKLRRSSFRDLLDSDWKHGVEAAVDIALLGRYYERIADHAVSIARRVAFLVTGDMPSPSDA